MSVVQFIGTSSPIVTVNYEDVQTILFALSAGVDARRVEYVYEDIPTGMRVHPAFGVLPAAPFVEWLTTQLGLKSGDVILGEQALENINAMPLRGALESQAVLKNIFDKGAGALASLEVRSRAQNGDLLVVNTLGI